jgi:hypothetical protein
MRLIIGMGFFALAVGYALLRGGGPERWFAGVQLGMLLIDRAGHGVLGNAAQGAIDNLHLFIDLAGFGGMVLVMIRARRLWPIWACSFQLLSLASHAIRVLSARLPPVIPAILGIAPNYLICVSLIVGTALHQARRRRRGSDPSWRSSSPRAAAPMRRSTRSNF